LAPSFFSFFSFPFLQVLPRQVHVSLHGALAVVVCQEDIFGSQVVGDPSPPPKWSGTATSLFRKVRERIRSDILVQTRSYLDQGHWVTGGNAYDKVWCARSMDGLVVAWLGF
jgi:hypothetical protein